MEKEIPEQSMLEGEHQANDKLQIDWSLYHANTPKLTLGASDETRKNQKKKIDR